MKTKTIFIFMLFGILFCFFTGNSMYGPGSINNPGNILYTSTTGGEKFIIGALNSGHYSNLNNVSDLGFNLWHKYSAFHKNAILNRDAPDWDSAHDNVTSDISEYVGNVAGLLHDGVVHGMNAALLMRPKTEWLCFGQRSDYQCEPISQADDKQWFYSFNENPVGTPVPDSGGMVIHCEVNRSLSAEANSGFVVKRLKSNTEQCNPGNFHGDHQSTWFIKPKIRINSNVPNNTKVCQIVVIKENGTTKLMETDILAKDFKNANGDYNGEYREEYTLDGGRVLTVDGNWGNNFWYHARGEQSENDTNVKNHADIQVKWYGECDMWIDYVRVDDDIAHNLFADSTNQTHNTYMQWLQWEAQNIAAHHTGESVYRFYLELFEYNSIPCMSYVSKKLDSLTFLACGKHTSLLCIPITTLFTIHVPRKDRVTVYSQTHFKKFFLDKMAAYDFMLASYPFNTPYIEGEAYTTSNSWSKIPNSLPNSSGFGTLAPAVSPAVYDTWLQEYFDAAPYYFEPGGSSNFDGEYDPGNFTFNMKRGDSLSKKAGIPFIFNAQAHIWKHRDTSINNPIGDRYIPGEVQREPTNEELDLTANLAISYGAKGIIYFEYNTVRPFAYGSKLYDRGMEDGNNTPRYFNVYGQPKWNKIKAIVQRVKKWEPYVMSFDNTNRHSYIYRLEKTAMASGSFINDLLTTKYNNISDSYEDETVSNRYVQASVFKNDSSDTRYFMIVNRRCSPVDTIGNIDGRRKIKIKFNSEDSYGLANFDNWKILDVEADTLVATFDKNSGSFVNLDWFNPGQGKLYKVVPVMKTGGTFVGNESIASVQFNFNNPVNTNGKNLTLGGGVNIYFKDSSQLKVNGGNFICGTYTDALDNPKSVNLLKQSGSWRGVLLENMDTVIVQNTLLQDVDTITNNYSLTILNSKNTNVDNCNIYNQNSLAGGVYLYFLNNTFYTPNVNISRNKIKTVSSVFHGINAAAYSSYMYSINIDWNNIQNTSGSGGGTGIFTYGLLSSVLKNNYITNYLKGVECLYSSFDVYHNDIQTISNNYDARCVTGIGTTFNMYPVGGHEVGGQNVLKTDNGWCLGLDASYINSAYGYNVFRIDNTTYGYHLRGYLPITPTADTGIDVRGNCFMINSAPVGDVSEIKRYVIWANTSPIELDLSDPTCGMNPSTDCGYYIAQSGFTSDTIWSECEGMGGGQKGNHEIQNGALRAEVVTFSQIYDSMNVNMRKRQYALAESKCKTLLNEYPDNLRTVEAVSKLYLASIVQDVNGSKIDPLKSYYETLVQNHPNNTELIQIVFFYIQKCKASLHQYTSAMQGFQTIMNQFPTSYEGLAARWDFMATQLLDTTSGQGGGEKDVISDDQLTDEQRHEKLISLVEDPLDKYDKKKFTKEDRKVIVKNIVTAFEDKKVKETQKLKELELKVIKNEANESEKKEYRSMKTLKEVVKTQNVRTVNEHINAVQGDIKKVFSLSENGESLDNKTVSVPLEYKLNQNYPNPFNPTTKINYQIKTPGFVSLKVYDLLGRTIAELVNERLEAGAYTIDFNASKYMLASGIYFYQIRAGEFVDTKRMVLVK